MIATETTVFDGQTYNVGDEIPDLGSLRCVKATGNIRQYKGLEKDASKLPKYDSLGTGSSFMASDSDMYKEYEETTKTWFDK